MGRRNESAGRVCCSGSRVTLNPSLRRPRGFRSGASVRGRTRLSKAGNARLRRALGLPTLTAVRFNPVLEGFFGRLVAAGKPRMPAVGACMRKPVMLCYGVLKNRAPFDPEWASRTAR
jgi:transposase